LLFPVSPQKVFRAGFLSVVTGILVSMDDDAGGEVLKGPFAAVLCPSRGEILALLDQAMFGLSDVELLDSIRAVEQVKAAADSVYLSLLATVQTRPEAVPGAAPGKAAVTFLTEGLRVSRGRAARDARASVAVAAGTGSMPALAAAFAHGEITREHVDVAVAAANKLPAAVKRLTSDDGVTGLQVLDGLVTEQAKVGRPGTVDQLGKDLLMVMDPDRACRLDKDAVQRRVVVTGWTIRGCTCSGSRWIRRRARR